MGETPSWAQLHEWEPGLVPDSFRDREGESWWPELFHERGGYAQSPDRRTLDALCRDRACEWIAEKRPKWHLRGHGGDPKGMWHWAEFWRHEFCGIDALLRSFPTRDEALRAACAAVIGARRAPAPSASSPGTAPPATP